MGEADLAPDIRHIQNNNTNARDGPVQQTLGLVWNTITNIKKPTITIPEDGKITKRQVVSVCHQFFDPLNCWAPLLTQMKLCCSEIVRQVTD